MAIPNDLPSSQPSFVHTELLFPDLPTSSQIQAVASSTRPRRPPTITPKRFTRFFAPRQTTAESRKSKTLSRASRKLRDITKNANNQTQTPPQQPSSKVEEEDVENFTPRRSKRIKLTPVPESSPLQFQSSPSKHIGDFRPIDLFDDAASVEDYDQLCDDFARLPAPITRVRNTNTNRMLQRSFGGPSVLQRGRWRDPCVDWRHSTAEFYSGSEDVCDFDASSLPFCVTACNTNSLVALGGESGTVTLLDSLSDPTVSFSKNHITFKPHHNAIMDMSFSSDDYLIATASGDQTARVTDMRTQQTRYIMAGHVSSVKTVRFQPGNDSVLATSSRDGSVQIWDLRCRGTSVPPGDLGLPRTSATKSLQSSGQQVVYARTCISIRDAHSSAGTPPLLRKSSADLFSARSTPAPSLRNDVSITALTFLPGDRSHILLSASEANATVKVWDIRGKYNRRGAAVPLASTREPQTHRSRKYGINSLALSGDGGRMYALCRDSTVYAYSTNHLILGHAPELDSPALKSDRAKWRGYSNENEGLGPLYGFKHPDFKVGSFYVKAGVRKAGNGKEEMLAVGSRDGCPILFPTDEAHFKRVESDERLPRDASLPGTHIKRITKDDELPIYEHGTALVRGHRKEVTSLSWTADGGLVTVSDDFSARCWREGAKARELRQGGEGQGQRWGCGWADVDQDFDEEDM